MTPAALKRNATATIVYTDGKSIPEIAELPTKILMGQSDRVLLSLNVTLGTIFPTIFRAGREYRPAPIDHPTVADRAGAGHLHELIERAAATDVHIPEGSLSNMLGGDLTRVEVVRAALARAADDTGANIVLTVPVLADVAAQPLPPAERPPAKFTSGGIEFERGCVTKLNAAQAVHAHTLGAGVTFGAHGGYARWIHAFCKDLSGRESTRKYDAAHEALTAQQWAEDLLAQYAPALVVVDAELLGDRAAALSIRLDADELAVSRYAAVAVV